MTSYNRVVLMGNLTREPELRYTPAGTAIAKMGMAMNRKWRDKDDQLQDEVTFVDVDAFGKLAETMSKYLHKGAGVLIDGRLRWHQWETPTGEKKNRLNVVALDMRFLPRGNGGGHAIAAGEPRADAASALTDVEDDADPFDGFPTPLGLDRADPGRRGDA